MRKFIDGDGVDVTATVLAFQEANNQYNTADLVLIGELEDEHAVFLTDYPSPLRWKLWGTFLSGAIGSRGKVSSQIGLQVGTMEFSWSPKTVAFGSTLATANAFQKAQSGFFDSKKFRLWRTIMPTPGDANTFGACEMFGGRIADTTIERNKITFTVSSFLDVVNQLIPPNVIEWTNASAAYAGNIPVISDGETQLPQFTVVAPSSATSILGQCTGPTPNKIYGANKFLYGFIKFNQGSSLAGYFSAVSSNGDIISSGVHYNRFTVYQAFPWDPQVGDTFYAGILPPINAADGLPAFPYDGYRWVPQPEGAA